MTRPHALALVALAATGLAALAQVGGRSRTPTVADVDALLADLAQREKSLPTESYRLDAEREWVNKKLEQFSPTLNALPPLSTDSLAAAQTELTELEKAVTAAKSDDPKAVGDCLRKAVDWYTEAFPPFDTNLPYQATREFERKFFRKPVIADLITAQDAGPGAASGVRLKPIPDATTAATVLAALKADFLPAAKALVEDAKKRGEQEAMQRSQLAAKLKDAEKALENYRHKLTDALAKVTVKKDLSANLYWVIPAMGVLCLLTMGLIRLFPGEVMIEWVKSGQVIQFVTVMILVSGIMSLGLAGLLSENVLGTLLGGIGGYVLSRGVGQVDPRRPAQDPAPPGAPAPVGPTTPTGTPTGGRPTTPPAPVGPPAPVSPPAPPPSTAPAKPATGGTPPAGRAGHRRRR